MSEANLSKGVIWWRALRYTYIPPSIFPAVVGGMVGWAIDHTFSPWYFLLVLVGVVVNHMALNMTDDYFDYKHSVDHLKPGEKNPYTGGSGTLSAGLITPRSMFKAFVLCYLVTASTGIYLAIVVGWPVLAFGLFGVLCSIFYTAPPISFSHHGLGELGLLINFGPTIGLGSYYAQTQFQNLSVALQALLATLPMGIMLFSMITINEIPDYEEDKRAGKLTLVARYGKKAGNKLYILSWFFTYGVIVGAVAFGIMPLITLIALLSLPLVYRSVKVARAYYDDPMKMAPANLDMIRAHSVVSFLLIAAYSIVGLTNGADVLQWIFIIIVLAIVYAPVATLLIRLSLKKPH